MVEETKESQQNAENIKNVENEKTAEAEKPAQPVQMPQTNQRSNKRIFIAAAAIITVLLIAGIFYMLGGRSAQDDKNVDNSSLNSPSLVGSSSRRDVIVGRWELTDIDEIKVDGLGGYIEFSTDGYVSMRLPFETKELSAAWEFYTEERENGRTYRSYAVKDFSGGVTGIITITENIGVFSLDEHHILFKK